MFPVSGAGDFLGPTFPAGAGDFLTRPYNLGSGAGGYLISLDFSIEVINNIILREVNCRISSLSPIEAWADRSFIVERDAGLCRVTPLTPGGSYAVSLVTLDPLTGSEVRSSDTVIYVQPSVTDVDGSVVALKMPPQPFLLESLTFAIGKVIQSVGGRPSCRVAEDCNPGSTVLLVNSTLGFPRSGSILLDGNIYEYVDKCDTAFVLSEPLFFPLTTGDLLVSDVKSIPPRRPQ